MTIIIIESRRVDNKYVSSAMKVKKKQFWLAFIPCLKENKKVKSRQEEEKNVIKEISKSKK